MFNNGYYPDITFTCDQTDFLFFGPMGPWIVTRTWSEFVTLTK